MHQLFAPNPPDTYMDTRNASGEPHTRIMRGSGGRANFIKIDGSFVRYLFAEKSRSAFPFLVYGSQQHVAQATSCWNHAVGAHHKHNARSFVSC